MQSGDPAALIFGNLVYINFMWGLVNLLPIWPLDGGQFTGVVLGQANPSNGRRWTHVVGLLTAGVLAYLCLSVHQRHVSERFSLGCLRSRTIRFCRRMHQQSRFGGVGEDDEDWWRR